MKYRKPLTEKMFRVVEGPTFGDGESPWLRRLINAIRQANEADETRRLVKPTRDELLIAFDKHVRENAILSEQDARHIRDVLVGKPAPAGRPKDCENARLGRDFAVYVEFGKLSGKGIPYDRVLLKVGRQFDLGSKAVEAALARVRKLMKP